MLTNKELDILDYLSSSDPLISIHKLSDVFNLSSRSIRNYMDNIIKELGYDTIDLDKGIYHIDNKNKILEYLNNPAILSQSSELKKLMILYRFVFDGYVNLSEMSRTLEISRTTAKIYFEEILSNLSMYHFSVEPLEQRGLFLMADEDTIRIIQLQTLINHINLTATKQKILYPSLKRVFEVISEDHLNEFLKHIQNDLDTVLNEYAYLIVKNYLRIMVQRIQSKHNIESQLNDYFLIESKEYKVIQENIHTIENNCHITIDNEELIKLASLVVGSHHSYSNELMENTWFEHNLLITKIISLFSKYSNINLNYDVQLYQSLMNHLKPTMYRMLHSIKLTNIDHVEITTRFKHEFEITKKVLNELNFFTNMDIDQDEIALLTIHFKAALMRNQSDTQNKKKVLIVCSNGFGTSLLLEQQISSTYEVDVLSCIPLHFLPNYQNSEEVDLIITTIESIDFKTDIPMIFVHPILTSDDFKKLDQSFILQRKNQISLQSLINVVQENAKVVDVDSLKNDLLQNFSNQILNDIVNPDFSLVRFLPLENIKIINEKIDWKTAVHIGGELLVSNQFVKDSYVESMVKSFENYGSYMMLDEGIAIPHARNEDNVLATGISLIVLKHPVEFFENRFIKVFFSFCSLDHQEHLDALVTISNLVRESDFKQRIHSLENERDILAFILNHANLYM